MAEITTIDDTSTRRAYAVGTVPTAVFPVPFPFWTDGDLRVWVDGAPLTRGSGYTVSGAGEAGGGAITLTTAVTSCTVTIARILDVARAVAFPVGAGFKVPALNSELARLVALIQQVRDASPLTLSGDDPTVGPLVLPKMRAGRMLAFDGSGVPTATTSTAAMVDAVVQAGAAAGGLLYDTPPVVADGVATDFETGLPLTQQVQVIVSVGGVWQTPASYTVTGTKIRFVTAPPAGVTVRARVIAQADLASDVQSVNGQTGAVTITAASLGAATTAALSAGLAAKADTAHTHTPASLGAATASHTHAQADISGLVAALALLAPLASPALAGTPTAPTAPAGTATTQIATTAFVATALAALVSSSPAALDTLNELAAALGNDPNFATTVTTLLAQKAPLASPALTGTPTAPTAAPGVSTTQIATTAFVQAVAALLAPLSGATFTGPARSKVSSVAYAATVTLDLSTGNDFIVGPLGGALTLANPTNQAGGHGGVIQITQGAAGGVTPTFGSNWKLLNAAAAWSTAANGVSLISYYIVTPGVVSYTVGSRAA